MHEISTSRLLSLECRLHLNNSYHKNMLHSPMCMPSRHLRCFSIYFLNNWIRRYSSSGKKQFHSWQTVIGRERNFSLKTWMKQRWWQQQQLAELREREKKSPGCIRKLCKAECHAAWVKFLCAIESKVQHRETTGGVNSFGDYDLGNSQINNSRITHYELHNLIKLQLAINLTDVVRIFHFWLSNFLQNLTDITHTHSPRIDAGGCGWRKQKLEK